MQTLDAYDVPKETAEKVLKNVMDELKKVLDADDQNQATVQKVDDLLSVEQTRTIYNRLGIIAMALAHQYSNEEQFQTTINTVSRENVRLTDTIMVLSEQLGDANKTIEVIIKENERQTDELIQLRSML